MYEDPSEDFFQKKEIHLSEYIMVLMKRRTLIILIFVLTVIMTAFHTSTVDPVFQSSARLIIDKESNRSPISGNRTDDMSIYSNSMTFNTTISMITSSPVIREVIRALSLDETKKDLEISFFRQWISRVKANIRLLIKNVRLPITEGKEDSNVTSISPEELENRKIQSLISAVRNKILVEQVPQTQLIEIRVKDKDPNLAASIADTLAKKYIDFDLANKMDTSRQTLAWFTDELYDLRKKLEDDEQKFFEYKQENLVFSIEGKQTQAEQKIREFNSRYLETRNKRLELDAKINELQKNLGSIKAVANVRSLINNPLIESIYAKIVDLEIELTRLSEVYKGKHPKIVQAQTELEKTRASLAQEIAKEHENLKSERKVLFAREKTLENSLAEFEKDALDTSAKELQYTILQRNVDTSKNLYDMMVSRVKESNILQSAITSDIRLVESAQVPSRPISPNKRRNLLLSVVLGFFFGCVLAYFFEYMDQTLRTDEDIQQYFNLPVLSVIPKADKSISYGADY